MLVLLTPAATVAQYHRQGQILISVRGTQTPTRISLKKKGHISLLELKVSWMVLKFFLSALKCILILSNNVVTVMYINHQGSMRFRECSIPYTESPQVGSLMVSLL